MLQRKTWAIAVLIMAAGVGGFGEQITKVAVLDIEKVYSIYFRESKSVKEFQEKQAVIQKEFNRLDEEILGLESEKLEAEAKGEVQKALALDKQLLGKKQYRDDYKRIKTQQLKKLSDELYQSDTFLDELLQAINFVAESEGYALVLNNSRQYKQFFFFYTKEIDITDKVIQELMKRAGKATPGGG